MQHHIGIDASTQDSLLSFTGRDPATSIQGTGTLDWPRLLDLALISLSPDDEWKGWKACVAHRCGLSTEKEEEILLAASQDIRFEALKLAPSPLALAWGMGLGFDLSSLAITVAEEGASLALVVNRAAVKTDFVRPIRGRNAREIAVAARCLVKAHFPTREARSFLLGRTLVGGASAAVEAVGRKALEEELSSVGCSTRFAEDEHAIARGAYAISLRIT